MPTSYDAPTPSEYKRVRKLGAGAFGEVWEASGPGGLGVALKYISLNGNRGDLEFRSLQAMSLIRHPNLVSVFGVWQKDNWLILAMELCDETLQDRLVEALDSGLSGIPFEELLSYMRDAANGLDALKVKRVQHRDVKPANLLLSGSGVKVADFGLAKALENTVASNTTGGTLGFIAPECYRGHLTDQSDQYSLAVTYFYLRTGRLLFSGNHAQMIYSHLESEPDLSQLPPAESFALARALSKEPEKRWENCATFVKQLSAPQPVVAGSQRSSHSPRAEKSNGKSSARSKKRAKKASNETQQRQISEEQALLLNAEQPRSAGETVVLHLSGAPITFAWCPAGSFLMGSDHEEAYCEEKPVHRVTLTKGFFIGIHPITQAQWKAVMGENPSCFKGSDRPVENVSWDDAKEFCRKLTARVAGRVTIRLPLEAEWEYACRAGTTTEFHFGNLINTSRANYDASHSWNGSPEGECRNQTTEVGSFGANRWGLFDMHGNVWEWCEDWLGEYITREQTDPIRLSPGTDACRIMRGGSWRFTPDFCRAASRDGRSPDSCGNDVGFRVCFHLAPVPQPEKQVPPSDRESDFAADTVYPLASSPVPLLAESRNSQQLPFPPPPTATPPVESPAASIPEILKTALEDAGLHTFIGRLREAANAAYVQRICTLELSGYKSGDSAIVFHEIGHHYALSNDFARNLPPDIQRGIEQFDYVPQRQSGKVKTQEGFAEWYRRRQMGQLQGLTSDQAVASQFAERWLASKGLTDKTDKARDLYRGQNSRPDGDNVSRPSATPPDWSCIAKGSTSTPLLTGENVGVLLFVLVISISMLLSCAGLFSSAGR